ncbi:c-type cytochrome [Sedimenticola thiotaurini]|uniref:Cytochrome c domain-containing protein n=1 Tax=Sedimenticola thiotaurini TaxID=1543721 RepID=A0A0F7JT57_9GAMM|nr:cytochrome c [Sedimenticola thiotaurini]AKH19641.1 hypothetical protein AAY24_03890 [Sedimenticola thiotaurini]
MMAGPAFSLFTLLTALTVAPVIQAGNPDPDDPVARGEYLFNMGGCASCHTAREDYPLAGGLAMETAFGVFYTPNITPDKSTGIGHWSEADFIAAMSQGKAPDGSYYYPIFPYNAYSKMSRDDLLDLKRYLDTRTPIVLKNRPHQPSFPYNFRPLIALWRLVNFDGAPFQPDPDKSQAWNRGAYIVNGPGRCNECHSPRNFTGGISTDARLKGNPLGPEGESVPGLTMTADNRISQWSDEDILFSLKIGMTPDGDFLGGSMGQVIEDTTGKLSEEDLKAITHYLRDTGESK